MPLCAQQVPQQMFEEFQQQQQQQQQLQVQLQQQQLLQHQLGAAGPVQLVQFCWPLEPLVQQPPHHQQQPCWQAAAGHPEPPPRQHPQPCWPAADGHAGQQQAQQRPQQQQLGVRQPPQGSLPGAQVPAAPTRAAPAARFAGHAAARMPAHDPPADLGEVLEAVKSLYRDELRPYGRILRKRVSERVAAAGLGTGEVDAKWLLDLCESCPALLVRSEKGGDWCALLRDQPECFVDVHSPEDPYPEELWEAAGCYFGSLGQDRTSLPGGRYSCAQVLAERGLPFLAGRSLGQVAHIVQLAISKRKLLGYMSGAVVPYGRSQSMMKERCAESQRPCAGPRGAARVASWEMVREFLEGAISSGGPAGSIPLSNIKRMFRASFGAELSETSLGHSKLSELLQDPRVGHLCSVRLQKHGYAVCPPRAAAPPAPRPEGRRARPLPPALEEIAVPPTTAGAGGAELFPPTPEGSTPCWQQVAAATAAPQARRLPMLLGRRGAGANREEKCATAAADCPKAQSIWTMPLLTPHTLDTLRAGLEQNTFIHVPEPASTPSAGARSRSLSAGP